MKDDPHVRELASQASWEVVEEFSENNPKITMTIQQWSQLRLLIETKIRQLPE